MTIAIDGSIKVELSGLINSKNRGISNFNKAANPIHILGRLIDSDRAVFLVEADSVGMTIKSHNVDHENYVAHCCLVADCQPAALARIACSIDRLEMPFDKYDDWLFSNPIKTRRTKNNVYLSFRRPEKVSFSLRDRIVSLRYQMHGPWRGTSQHRDINLRSNAFLDYACPEILAPMEAVRAHRQFHDLLIVLSGQEVSIDWPQVSQQKDKFSAKLYYKQFYEYDKEFEYHRCWISYPQIAHVLPNILEKWIEGNEKFGPGFYLYLSTHRGYMQYYENRFMALVGGLEALHRKTQSNTGTGSTHVANKVIRFVCEHPQANKRVRKWVKRKLSYAAEPSLEDRLFDLMRSLHLNLNELSLRRFCKICADARNDIAHFGKITRLFNEDEVIQKLHDLANALDHLYHVCILQKIGIDADMLRSIIASNNRFYLVKKSLLMAGLEFSADTAEGRSPAEPGDNPDG